MKTKNACIASKREAMNRLVDGEILYFKGVPLDGKKPIDMIILNNFAIWEVDEYEN